MDNPLEMITPAAVVILLATMAVDRTRAYRAVPAAMNRLRRWRATDRSTTGQDR